MKSILKYDLESGMLRDLFSFSRGFPITLIKNLSFAILGMGTKDYA